MQIIVQSTMLFLLIATIYGVIHVIKKEMKHKNH